ncbi:unnamed protein product, partial [Durusdinium trenchii]
EPSAQEPSNPLEALQECGAFDWVSLEAALKEAVKGVSKALEQKEFPPPVAVEPQ